jgi:putative transposase
MVKLSWDYQWSSARFHVGKRGLDELVTDRSLRQMVNNWHEFLEGGDDDVDKKLRLATHTGRPAGDEQFLLKIESLSIRNIRKKKPGLTTKSNNAI